jgi:hypothetical protein
VETGGGGREKVEETVEEGVTDGETESGGFGIRGGNREGRIGKGEGLGSLAGF